MKKTEKEIILEFLEISGLAFMKMIGELKDIYELEKSETTEENEEEKVEDTYTEEEHVANELQLKVETKANEIIDFSKSLIGQATYGGNYSYEYPYQFKCASFVEFVFRANGIDLGSKDEDYMIQQGIHVDREDLQKGDLVFFRNDSESMKPSHVGIYIGNGDIIHMANSKLNIVISDVNNSPSPYYQNNYMGARRIIPFMLPSNPPTQADKIVDFAYDLMDKVTMGKVTNEEELKFTGVGFINYVYKQNGIELGGTLIRHVREFGETVSREDLQKGDLIYISGGTLSNTPSYIGIYCGENRLIIPSSTGVVSRVIISDYYGQRFIEAKRVI